MSPLGVFVAAIGAIAGTVCCCAAVLGGGDVERGRTLFEERCSMCHAAEALRGKGCRVCSDLRRLSAAMSPVGLLSEDEVAALAAYLDDLPVPRKP